MQIQASHVSINAFTISVDGEKFITSNFELNSPAVHGWNVQAWGLIDETAGILDDEDFKDMSSAFAYALTLTRQYHLTSDGMGAMSTTMA
jgi:hypothetical protein